MIIRAWFITGKRSVPAQYTLLRASKWECKGYKNKRVVQRVQRPSARLHKQKQRDVYVSGGWNPWLQCINRYVCCFVAWAMLRNSYQTSSCSWLLMSMARLLMTRATFRNSVFTVGAPAAWFWLDGSAPLTSSVTNFSSSRVSSLGHSHTVRMFWSMNTEIGSETGTSTERKTKQKEDI